MEREDLRARLTASEVHSCHQDYEHRSMKYEDFHSHCAFDRAQAVLAAANQRKCAGATVHPFVGMRELERARMQCEDFHAQFIQQSRRLSWHETVRDWISSTGADACLHQAQAGTWPSWVVLDAQILNTL